jgi:Zn-dependent protease with chaperone function
MSSWLRSDINAMAAGQGMDLLTFVLVPLAAAMLVRTAVYFLGAAVPVSRVQVWFARAAAAMPGIVFLGLGPTVFRSAHARPVPMLLCILHCYGLFAVFAGVLLSRMFAFGRQFASCQRLLEITEAPSERNAKLATELGIRLRVLPSQFSVCVVTGIWKPVVVISRGTLESLSWEELRAALMHERAHCRGRETCWAAGLWFLSGATFAPVRSAFDAYKRASEFAADGEAIREVCSVTLASALVAVARSRRDRPLLAGLASRENLRERVALLVGAEDPKKACRGAGVLISVALAAAATLPLVGGIARNFVHVFCR